MKMLKPLFATQPRFTLLLLRIVLGFLFFVHGAQLVFGWFGGSGLGGSINAFTEKMAIPVFLAYLAVFSQFFGGLALIFGFATRLAALGIAVDMIVAIFLVHLPHGLFMNWYGNQKGEGYEYHLLAIVIALTLVIAGGGILSIDRSIAAPREQYR
jgi:putative oxidoreductase